MAVGVSKELRARKLVMLVPPAYSSQTCAACGHVHPDSRLSQAEFVCQDCGYTDNADHNASVVVKQRVSKNFSREIRSPRFTNPCGFFES